MNPQKKDAWPLVRFIVPAFPEVNVFTRPARKTTPLGPICVATSANKVWGWRVEVVDENNYVGPVGKQGMPDHESLEKENPATAVCFYCGLSSTMERVYELADFYNQRGATIVAGGWHAHFCPEEALANNIDFVVHGDGEVAIQEILAGLLSKQDVTAVAGVSFLDNGCVRTNAPVAIELPDLNSLPYPDFGLLRYARKLKIYPIGRIRGCRMNCEFCSVKGKPRWANPEYLFGAVNWLVDTRKARKFFIVDDRLEEDLPGTLAFFRMIRDRYGDRLKFTVQIRLETAKNPELLEIMKSAGVRIVCVGYESPIDEDLKIMRKGYRFQHMLEWTKVLCRYFWVHGMFIFGYPHQQAASALGVEEMIKRFKSFIRKSGIQTIQVMHPIPLVGTALRARLQREGRIFPLDIVGWRYYDGNYTYFMPEGMSIREFQETPIKLMKWFYSRYSFWRIPLWIVAFPIHFLVLGWQHWYRTWERDIVKYGGHLLVRRWQRGEEARRLLERIQEHQKSVSR